MCSPDRVCNLQDWYSGMLVQHGADVIDAVMPVVRSFQQNGSGPKVGPCC